jgi:hypothetical protein
VGVTFRLYNLTVTSNAVTIKMGKNNSPAPATFNTTQVGASTSLDYLKTWHAPKHWNVYGQLAKINFRPIYFLVVAQINK